MGSLFFLFEQYVAPSDPTIFEPLNNMLFLTTFSNIVKPILRLTFKTPKSGAQTSLYTALDEDLANESGKYYA